MKRTLCTTVWACSLLLALAGARADQAAVPDVQQDVTQGALRIVKEDGVVECPLEHTDVQADIAGFIARVKVRQTFHNPTNEKIEAVYVFPLPHQSAIDDMTMVVGDRRIVGLIKRRDEARDIYQRALLAGQTAALLEQERPNIFTQSVGNIEPGARVHIEISYVDVLDYDMGRYTFRFPMVVGPRYSPGDPVGSQPPVNPELQGRVAPPAPDTTVVPDNSRINPPILKPGERTGHDISLSVSLNAGVPVQKLESTNHAVDRTRHGDSRYDIRIASGDTLPNKDFVLTYEVMGQKPQMALLAHRPEASTGDDARGYFMLMIQPGDDERVAKSPPRELTFLVDVSGSMSGEPTAKVIEAMRNMLQLCRADKDTVQVITFAGSTSKLFERPVPATKENIARALSFADGFSGSGGTNMLEGVQAAISDPLDEDRMRIVVMLTDGYIGNESQIAEYVGEHCGDRIRFWAIGIGSSPNMHLIDGVARHGGGMGKTLALTDDAKPITTEIMTRIQRAQLSDVRIDYGTLDVTETFPARIPELWYGRPIVVFGRFNGSGQTDLTISGNAEGEAVSWPLTINLPAAEPANAQLASTWARRKIEDLMQQTYYAGSPAIEEMVTQIALQYRLMSPYTSFVAVDEKELGEIQPNARPPRRMLVPVPLPAGTSYEGFFGNEGELPGNPPVLAAIGGDQGFVRAEHAAQQLASVPMRVQAELADRIYVADGSTHFMGMSGPPAGRETARDAQRLNQFADRAMRTAGPYAAAPQQMAAQMVTEAAQAEPSELAQLSTQAQQATQEGRFAEARDLAIRLYFLDLAHHYRSAQPWEQPHFALAALASVEDIHAKQVAAWQQDLPILNQRLDLVIRDQSLADAINQLAQATGVTFNITDGSIEDVAALFAIDTARVSFLDLRNATLTQALDWITQPNRLSWWIDDGQIHIATDRRRDGQRAWVYDVNAIAWPQDSELPQQPDEAQAAGDEPELTPLGKELQRFADLVQSHLGDSATAVAWVGNGQLVVIADAATHQRAAELFEQLADPAATFDGDMAELHTLTSARAEARKEAIAQHHQAAELSAVAARLNEYTWPLLAAAANGQVDLEALAELQIAWRSPRLPELFHDAGHLLAVRSAWAIHQSARRLPDAAELQELADLARRQVNTAPASQDYLITLYRLMMQDASHQPSREVIQRLHPPHAVKPEFTAQDMLVEIGRAVDPDQKGTPFATVDAQRIADLITQHGSLIQGEDMIVLTALAARQAGRETWDAFRAQQQQILARQPLHGSVIVLINRLATATLPAVASR